MSVSGSDKSRNKTILLYGLEVLGAFLCLHHVWPKGIIYGDEDDAYAPKKKEKSKEKSQSRSPVPERRRRASYDDRGNGDRRSYDDRRGAYAGYDDRRGYGDRRGGYEEGYDERRSSRRVARYDDGRYEYQSTRRVEHKRPDARRNRHRIEYGFDRYDR